MGEEGEVEGRGAAGDGDGLGRAGDVTGEGFFQPPGVVAAGEASRSKDVEHGLPFSLADARLRDADHVDGS